MPVTAVATKILSALKKIDYVLSITNYPPQIRTGITYHQAGCQFTSRFHKIKITHRRDIFLFTMSSDVLLNFKISMYFFTAQSQSQVDRSIKITIDESQTTSSKLCTETGRMAVYTFFLLPISAQSNYSPISKIKDLLIQN